MQLLQEELHIQVSQFPHNIQSLCEWGVNIQFLVKEIRCFKLLNDNIPVFAQLC